VGLQPARYLRPTAIGGVNPVFEQLPDRARFIIDAMAQTREEILRERRHLKAQYGVLFDSVAALLFRHDPIGIAFDDKNTDEYEPEAGTILPRPRRCESHADALRVVHEEFVRWFGADIAGPEEWYAEIASEIWHLWMTHRLPTPGEQSHS
jgi:hypothetical protein